MKPLLDALMDEPLARLLAIAELTGTPLAAGSQQEAATQLAASLTDPVRTRQVVAACGPEARAALSDLMARGGKQTLPAFERAHGNIRVYGPSRLAREAPWRSPVSASEELWYRGLIAKGFGLLGERAVEFVFVPSDVLPHLSPGAAPAPAFDLMPVAPPKVVSPANDALLEDACTLLCFVQEGVAWTDQRGHWQESSLRALNERLLLPAVFPGSDLARSGAPLALLLHLASVMGWLNSERRHLRLQGAQTRQWLELTVDQQREALASAWRDSREWDDLCRVPGLRCEGTMPHDPLAARASLLGHLRACELGLWYALADFTAAVKRVDPDFQRPDGNYDSWYLRDAGSGRYLRGFENWEHVEGALIGYVIAGPAHWLRATDLGDQDAEIQHGEAPDARSGVPPSDRTLRAAKFRLTPAGASWLGLAPAPSTRPAAPPLVVRPDYRVLAPHGTRCLDRFRLSRFADWEASTPAFTYRITRRALQRARREGIDARRISGFLRRASHNRLPPNVARSLAHWES
jgi:hypothetical protein